MHVSSSGPTRTQIMRELVRLAISQWQDGLVRWPLECATITPTLIPPLPLIPREIFPCRSASHRGRRPLQRETRARGAAACCLIRKCPIPFNAESAKLAEYNLLPKNTLMQFGIADPAAIFPTLRVLRAALRLAPAFSFCRQSWWSRNLALLHSRRFGIRRQTVLLPALKHPDHILNFFGL